MSVDLGYTSVFRILEIAMRAAAEGRLDEAATVASSSTMAAPSERDPITNMSVAPSYRTPHGALQMAVQDLSVAIRMIHRATKMIEAREQRAKETP